MSGRTEKLKRKAYQKYGHSQVENSGCTPIKGSKRLVGKLGNDGCSSTVTIKC